MWILIAWLFATVLLVVGGIALYTYLHYRGARFVKCPDNRKVEAVTLDAGKAAFCAAIGNPQLELRECTRWPEMKGCGQECMRQIEFGSKDCLVRNVVGHWYEGQRCAICGDTFGEIHWHDHAPALLDPDGRTVQWQDVPLERLTAYMESHNPVCWNCHIVRSFRAEHPDLITYRKER